MTSTFRNMASDEVANDAGASDAASKNDAGSVFVQGFLEIKN